MSRAQRLFIVLALNLALAAALVAVGVIAHSLAVLAEGGDYLLDAAGVGVALLAIRLTAPSASVHGGTAPKASNVAALINGGWLLVTRGARRLRSGGSARHRHTAACGRLACTHRERYCSACNGWRRSRPPWGR